MAAILINGINYSWSTLNNIAFGVPVIGITAINWDRDQVKENNHGQGVEPVSRGYGNVSYTGQMTVYKDWWMSVVNAAPSKDILLIPPFDWTIAYGNANTPIVTETLKAFEFLKDTSKGAQGDTKLLLDIPFIWAGLVRS